MTTIIVLVALWLTGWALCELYNTANARASYAKNHAQLERFAHPRAIRDQANSPQPDPYVYDPASFYDAVLLSLSPSIRRDFQSPTTTHSKEPSVSEAQLLGLRIDRRPGKDGLPGPSLKEGLPGPSNIIHTVDGPAGPS